MAEGCSTEMEITTQAKAWLLLGRAAHTALPISHKGPYAYACHYVHVSFYHSETHCATHSIGLSRC